MRINCCKADERSRKAGRRKTSAAHSTDGKYWSQVFPDRSVLRSDRGSSHVTEAYRPEGDDIQHSALAMCFHLDRGCIRGDDFHLSCRVSAWWLKTKSDSGANRVLQTACFGRREATAAAAFRGSKLFLINNLEKKAKPDFRWLFSQCFSLLPEGKRRNAIKSQRLLTDEKRW